MEKPNMRTEKLMAKIKRFWERYDRQDDDESCAHCELSIDFIEKNDTVGLIASCPWRKKRCSQIIRRNRLKEILDGANISALEEELLAGRVERKPYDTDLDKSL